MYSVTARVEAAARAPRRSRSAPVGQRGVPLLLEGEERVRAPELALHQRCHLSARCTARAGRSSGTSRSSRRRCRSVRSSNEPPTRATPRTRRSPALPVRCLPATIRAVVPTRDASRSRSLLCRRMLPRAELPEIPASADEVLLRLLEQRGDRPDAGCHSLRHPPRTAETCSSRSRPRRARCGLRARADRSRLGKTVT